MEANVGFVKGGSVSYGLLVLRQATSSQVGM